jgi:UDP-3-O-[3-hydroxymyristoyl] glucosamine N-acyltransferase
MAAMCGIAGSTKVGEHCIFGGQSGIAGHLTIADNTSLGAQTGVVGNIKTPGQAYMGTPAIPHREYLRSYAIFRKAGK